MACQARRDPSTSTRKPESEVEEARLCRLVAMGMKHVASICKPCLQDWTCFLYSEFVQRLLGDVEVKCAASSVLKDRKRVSSVP